MQIWKATRMPLAIVEFPVDALVRLAHRGALPENPAAEAGAGASASADADRSSSASGAPIARA
jgi:hypothetical protein